VQDPRLVLDTREGLALSCPHCGEAEELERRNDKMCVCQVCCRVFEVR